MRGGRETTGEARMRYAFAGVWAAAATGGMCWEVVAVAEAAGSAVAVAAEAYWRA